MPGVVQMLDVWNNQAATIVAGSGMKSDRDDVKDKIQEATRAPCDVVAVPAGWIRIEEFTKLRFRNTSPHRR
jgi:hypothetical protein